MGNSGLVIDSCLPGLTLSTNACNVVTSSCSAVSGNGCSTCNAGYYFIIGTHVCVTPTQCNGLAGYVFDSINQMCIPSCAYDEFYDIAVDNVCKTCDSVIPGCTACVQTSVLENGRTEY